MLIEISVLEAYQVQAALERRMAVLARGERLQTPGSLEADMVALGIRYTGSILASLTEALYGTHEPDEMPDLLSERAAHDEHERIDRECSLCEQDFNSSYWSVIGRPS